MHNGVFGTLEEVLNFYENFEGGEGESNQNPQVLESELDKKLLNLQVDDNKIASIIAFLNTLNDNNFDSEVPSEVPSGLNPGGNIK